MVHQQNRVVDDDSEHHDHADVGFPCEGSLGVEKDQIHPDERHRDGQNDAEWLEERLEERGRHHIDQQ